MNTGNVELRAQHILEFLLDNAYVKKETSSGNSHRASDNEHKSSSASACASLQMEGDKAEKRVEMSKGNHRYFNQSEKLISCKWPKHC